MYSRTTDFYENFQNDKLVFTIIFGFLSSINIVYSHQYSMVKSRISDFLAQWFSIFFRTKIPNSSLKIYRDPPGIL